MKSDCSCQFALPIGIGGGSTMMGTKAVLVLALVGACMIGFSLSATCFYPLLEVAFDDVSSQQIPRLRVNQGSSKVVGGDVNVTCLNAKTGASLACLDKDRCVDFMVKYCRRLQLTTLADGTKSIACDSRYRLSYSSLQAKEI